MVRIVFIYAALVLASAYTINAYWLGVNGYTTIELFDRLPVLLAPSEYVYLFFFVIIAINFVFFMTYKDEKKSFILNTSFQVVLFVCNVLVYVIVLYIWHNGQYMSATILQIALVLMAFSLYLTFPITKKDVYYRIPIALFFAWHLFSLLLMFNITLINYEWHGFGLSHSLWAVIFMTIGSMITLYLNYQYADRISSAVLTWCYIGIAFTHGFNELLVTTAAVFLSGVMLVGIWVIKKNRTPSVY